MYPKRKPVSRKKFQAGWIYALADPDSTMLKIGYTKNSRWYRCRQWSQKQGDGKPFEVVYEAYFNRASRIEKKIHSMLADHRIESEYFKITADEFKYFIRYNFKPINYLGLIRKAMETLRMPKCVN
jgi:hypothetical protein